MPYNTNYDQGKKVSRSTYYGALFKLSSNLRSFLGIKNLGSRELALKIEELRIAGKVPCGVSEHSISSYLHGRALPTRARLTSLAAGLGVPETSLCDPEMCADMKGRRFYKNDETRSLVSVIRSKRGLEYVRLKMDVTVLAKEGTELANILNTHLGKLYEKASAMEADREAKVEKNDEWWARHERGEVDFPDETNGKGVDP